MTKEEFDKLIEEQRAKGLDDEDIAVVFALMFKDGKLNREQIEGVLEAMGYEISPEFKQLDDEEFKEKILVQNENEPEEQGEGGKPAPKAEKQEAEVDEEETEKKETKDGDEEERKKAMKLFKLED